MALVDELPVVDDRLDTSSRARAGAAIATDFATLVDDREIEEDDEEAESGFWAGKLLVLAKERVLGGEVRLVGVRFFMSSVGRVTGVFVSTSTALSKVISDLRDEVGEAHTRYGGCGRVTEG